MNILHATTDPSLKDRLQQMLSSSERADIAVGYFFMSGFQAVADELARLQKVRILVGRTDRRVVEEVALALQQTQALESRLRAGCGVRKGNGIDRIWPPQGAECVTGLKWNLTILGIYANVCASGEPVLFKQKPTGPDQTLHS